MDEHGLRPRMRGSLSESLSDLRKLEESAPSSHYYIDWEMEAASSAWAHAMTRRAANTEDLREQYRRLMQIEVYEPFFGVAADTHLPNRELFWVHDAECQTVCYCEKEETARVIRNILDILGCMFPEVER